MKTHVLSKRMVIPIFMPFAFIGLMGLFFAILLLFIESTINPIRIAIPLIVGLASLGIAMRAKCTFFEEETGIIKLTWGEILPWNYKTYQKDSWMALKVEKRYPVVVMPSGGVTRVSHLPPCWDVLGLTKEGKTLLLNESKTEKEAFEWEALIAKSIHLKIKNLSAKIYLGNDIKGSSLGKEHKEIAKEAWKQSPFFKKNSAASKLYGEMCASSNWNHVRASSIYDADVTNELNESYFNIPLLASNVQVKKPWKIIQQLQSEGWIKASQKEIDQLVELEKKYGWATPDML